MESSRKGLFLIGHGSRSAEGIDEYWQFADVLRTLLPPDVELGCGFIEFAEPDLDEGIDALVAKGVEEIHAVPLVLLGAGHMKNDGPAALIRARSRHPAVRFRYARALGVHPTLLQVAEQRVNEAFESAVDSASASLENNDIAKGVLLVGRGSTDPDANSDLFKVARMLEEGRSMGDVQASFVSLAPPDVPSALDRLARLGARSIAVVPYFLFTGVLVERIVQQAREWAESHPEVSLACGRHLGPDPEVAGLVLERFWESVAGQTKMNCDGCVYRVALPGYEHKWRAPLDPAGHHGAAVHSHRHPHDHLHGHHH